MPAKDVLNAGIRTAVFADFAVIAGYALVLITCAVVFNLLVFSEAGKRFSKAMIGVVGLLVIADVLEDLLLLLSLNSPRKVWFYTPPTGLWQHLPAIAATAKWCAALVAILAVPLAVFSVGRLVLGELRRRRYSTTHRKREWWTDALPLKEWEQTQSNDDDEAAWRKAYCVPPRSAQGKDPENPAALCLSGGGVRSACVAMGATQAFGSDAVANSWPGARRLDEFDYVISVSGGGYAAGARLLSIQNEPASADAPLARPDIRLAQRFEPGSAEFAFLRRRSSYIADTPIGLVRALAQVLRNLAASLLLVFSLPVLIGGTLGWLFATLPLAAFVPLKEYSADGRQFQAIDGHAVAALGALAIPVVTALLCAGAGLAFEMLSTSERSTRWKERLSVMSRGFTLMAMLIFAVTIAVPGLMWLCSPLTDGEHGHFKTAGAIGGLAGVAVLQYGATLVSILSAKKKDAAPKGDSRNLTSKIPPGVVQLGIVVLTLAVLIAAWLLTLGIVAAQTFSQLTHDQGRPTGLLIALGSLALLAALLSIVDVTSLSLHPFYRRRLARTFAVRRIGGAAVEYPPSEATWLDDHGHTVGDTTQFVFAAAAAVSDDDVRPAPGLGCVSYVFTADYVGGPALGWLRTKGLRDVAAPRIKRDLTVQAAMAVSGAAFASAMGRQSKGFQTLLALSGARLGTWLPNPRFVKNARDHRAEPGYPKALPWVRGSGYFYRELLGINKSDARLLQITDGGHYENLGLVEALRRRCTLVYCIDAGGDTPPLLSGLDDAVRLAKFELGVDIIFEKGSDYGVENLAAGSGDPFGKGNAFHSLNSRVTKDVVLRARIEYPVAAGLVGGEPVVGWLIVAKALLWQDLPEWVLTYGAGKSGQEFPNDSTSDQWFSEAQFAAYTELGRRIGHRALQVAAPPTPACSPLENGAHSKTPPVSASPHQPSVRTRSSAAT